MYDERINKKLSIIKRNNLFIIAGVSAFYFLMRLVLNQGLNGYYHELFFMGASLLVLMIGLLYESSEEQIDERVEQNVLRIYNIGFWITVLIGLIFYYINVLLRIEYSNLHSLIVNPNSSINLILILCFILSYINVRKNKMTFNYKYIENSNKEYYSYVFRRILYLFIYFIFVGFILTILWQIFEIENLYFYIILGTILYTFLEFSISYLLFSIYEKIRYEELIEVESGIVKHVSKKVLFLFIVCSTIAILTSIVNLLYNFHIIQNGLLTNYFIGVLNIYLTSLGLITLVLVTIYRKMLYNSVRKSSLFKPGFYPIFNIIIWISLGLGIINWLMNMMSVTGMLNILLNLSANAFQIFTTINSIFSNGMLLISIIAEVFILIFFIKNNNRVFRNLVIVKLVIAIVPRIIVFSNFFRSLFLDSRNFIIFLNTMLLMISILTLAINFFIIKTLTKSYDQSPVLEEN